MKCNNLIRFIAVLCIGLMLPFNVGTAWGQAQNQGQNQQQKKEVEIEGRIYDFDGETYLHGVTVRIVSTTTGQARETDTDKNGCYNFDDVADDTYTFSVYYKGSDQAMIDKIRGEFLLPSKITVKADTEKDILIKTCASLGEKNALLLKEDCDLCKKVPPIIWIIPASALIAGSIIGRDDDDEVSPSRP